MIIEECISCQILNGVINAPGGVIYEDDSWLVNHTMPPVFIPGKLAVILKRHCENLAELYVEEAVAIGPMLWIVCQALQDETRAEKIHVASYGEGVRHVHFLITPRTSDLPASNLYLTLWLLWCHIRYQIGMRKFVHEPENIRKIVQGVRSVLSDGVHS